MQEMKQVGGSFFISRGAQASNDLGITAPNVDVQRMSNSNVLICQIAD